LRTNVGSLRPLMHVTTNSTDPFLFHDTTDLIINSLEMSGAKVEVLVEKKRG
jgi:hypothetical protein